MSSFELTINVLNEKINELKARLSADVSHEEKGILLNEIREISNAIYWLNKLQENDLSNKKIAELIKVPDIGYCDLRLVIDPESDDPSMWSEYKVNGESILLSTSDIILKIK